jgi:hypothetical protein
MNNIKLYGININGFTVIEAAHEKKYKDNDNSLSR